MFTVVWSHLAFEDTARIIRDNPKRKAEFAAALRQITEQLSDDPVNRGESREEEMRVMFADPLTVFFRVDESDRVAEIGNVWLPR